MFYVRILSKVRVSVLSHYQGAISRGHRPSTFWHQMRTLITQGLVYLRARAMHSYCLINCHPMIDIKRDFFVIVYNCICCYISLCEFSILKSLTWNQQTRKNLHECTFYFCIFNDFIHQQLVGISFLSWSPRTTKIYIPTHGRVRVKDAQDELWNRPGVVQRVTWRKPPMDQDPESAYPL